MDTQITTKPANLAMTQSDTMGGVEQGDLQIPQLSLVQKMSKLVDEGKAKAGDIWDSMEGVAVADEKTNLEFIPLHTSKAWRVFEVLGPQKKQYLHTVPYGPENADWQYNVTLDGKQINRQLVMSWHVLLVNQVTKGEAIPYRLSFKGTSIGSGRKLATMVAKGSFLKLPVYGKTYQLQSVKQTNDKGTFSVFDIKPGRVTTPEEQAIAAQWTGMFATKKVVDMDSEETPF